MRSSAAISASRSSVSIGTRSASLIRPTALGEVAFASGFNSVRRFNSAARDAYGCTPGELRNKGTNSARAQRGIRLELNYRPPLDWQFFLDFHAHHAIPGIESVDDGSYRRNIATRGGTASIRVRPHPRREVLLLDLELTDTRNLMANFCRPGSCGVLQILAIR